MSHPVFLQVGKAVGEMLEMIKKKKSERLFLLMAAMQSGKTAFIEHMWAELKKSFPEAIGLYVVSHNHKDFISQNFQRLEHLQALDFHCLTLKERRLGKIKKRPLKSYTNQPVFIFFDESHFGDRVSQTIDNWLQFNKLYPSRECYLLCVSATAFSSIKRAENTTVIYDQALMPSYKSVTAMLKRGDIKEADQILIIEKKKLLLNLNSEALKYLDQIVDKVKSGYVILRIPKKEHAEFLEQQLIKRYGREAIHIRHWNQENQLESPQEYFETFRGNIVTVVLVQQKARMGNTIPTKFVRMVYDYCPKASIATVAQGLLGRCCGHNKINDNVRIFSHLKQAKAYSIFEMGQLNAFYKFITDNGLKASERSQVHIDSKNSIVTEKFQTMSKSREEIRQEVKNSLVPLGSKLVERKIVVRILSGNKDEKEGNWYKEIIDSEIDEVGSKKLLRDNKEISVLVDDRKVPSVVYVTYRKGEYQMEHSLVPKSSSIFSVI